MITWESLRAKVRESIIRDPPTDLPLRWSDEELLSYCHWSLDQLCEHTALQVSAVISNDTEKEEDVFYDMKTDTEFELIPAPYASVTKTGLVFAQVPHIIRLLPATTPFPAPGQYNVWENKLILGAPIGNGELHLRYYGYYPKPVVKEDVIPVPEWAEAALVYMIGAHSMAGRGLRSATIRQWDEQGNRIQNPLLETQKWFISMYENVLTNHQPQNRVPTAWGVIS
jgi:hypothetical protein